ncbi:MAG: helix-turn-helix transcriptional regulator [Dermatophilaceae bacterium]|nr:helix-turn-helix transcriptional regulator [Dermatophilaceae bacterium]
MTAPTWPLGPKLKAAREALGLTKREAARRADISEQLWRRLESGYYTVQGERVPLRGRDGQNVGVTRETAISAARAVGLQPNEVLAIVGLAPEAEVDEPAADEVFLGLQAYLDAMARAHGPEAARAALHRLYALRNAAPNASPDRDAG